MGPEGGPLMMMKNSLFLRFSNVSGRGFGAGGGPLMMMEDFFFVSAYVKCFDQE